MITCMFSLLTWPLFSASDSGNDQKFGDLYTLQVLVCSTTVAMNGSLIRVTLIGVLVLIIYTTVSYIND